MALLRKLRGAARVAGDWRWFPFFLQRRIRRKRRRDAVAAWLGRRRPPPRYLDEARPETVGALAERGLALLGVVLDPARCEEARRFLEGRLVRDDYRPEVPAFLPLGERRHPQSHVAFHTHEDVIAAPHLLALANDPAILGAVEHHLGCRPTIAYLAAWWSYATGIAPQQAENFHRDVDDWRFLKLFVYLTDVDAEKGPHVYVTRSADIADISEIRRYDDAEVIAGYGEASIARLTGPAGSAFIENTYGIHKGQSVRDGTRLMFQAVYSLSVLPYGPRRPVAVFDETHRRMGIDPWVNRIYLR